MKIYKTLFLGLGLIALSSCSDFLNQTSPSELDNVLYIFIRSICLMF